jgi:hypothetical protein
LPFLVLQQQVPSLFSFLSFLSAFLIVFTFPTNDAIVLVLGFYHALSQQCFDALFFTCVLPTLSSQLQHFHFCAWILVCLLPTLFAMLCFSLQFMNFKLHFYVYIVCWIGSWGEAQKHNLIFLDSFSYNSRKTSQSKTSKWTRILYLGL